jgi:hypothetical protein
MEEDDDTSSDIICKELCVVAKVLYNESKECESRYKDILQKIKDKSKSTTSHILLPKTVTATKWLKSLNAPSEVITYDEFLDVFFDLYEREGRLDFDSRTLMLRPKDAKILGLHPDTPTSIYVFLGNLPQVFS